MGKIKRRLIEYLAVVRLKELNAEKERKEEEEKMADQVAMKEGEGKVEGGEKRSAMTGDVGALVPVNKNRNQNQQVVPHQQHPSVRPLSTKRVVKGPILLYVALSFLLWYRNNNA